MTVILAWIGTLCLLCSGFLFFQSRRLSDRAKDTPHQGDEADRSALEQRSNRMFMQAFCLFLFGVACKILNSYPRALESLHRFLNSN
ncbi:MAG: hypothetical protein ACOVS5_14105 [Oligoflexus sp.]|jgi:hypothetical protein